MIRAREKPALYPTPPSSQRSPHRPHPALGATPGLPSRWDPQHGSAASGLPMPPAARLTRHDRVLHQAATARHRWRRTRRAIGTFFRKPYESQQRARYFGMLVRSKANVICV